MSYTPSGGLSTSLDNFLATVAGSATWISWSGSANAAEAKEKIEIGGVADPTYPCAIATPNAEDLFESYGGGDGETYLDTGTFWLLFRAEISESNRKDEFFAFRNKVGDIIDEIKALAGTPGYLAIKDMAIAREQRRSSIQSEKHTTAYFDIILRFDWGP